MIKQILVILSLIIVQSVYAMNADAQVIQFKPAPAKVNKDGALNEWGNELPYSNKSNMFSYGIYNDHNNLYLVVKTKDTVCQANILGSGITFAISTKKTKAFQKITFPLRGKEDPSEWMDLDKEQVAMKAILARYKRVGVQNFKDIKAEQLSTANPYGIKVAIGYTDDGWMIYEEAIPLNLICTESIAELRNYRLKINGLARKVYFLGKSEFVPLRSGNRVERINNNVQTTYRGGFRMGGPMPLGDYEEKLTGDTEVKGEFVIAQ